MQLFGIKISRADRIFQISGSERSRSQCFHVSPPKVPADMPKYSPLLLAPFHQVFLIIQTGNAWMFTMRNARPSTLPNAPKINHVPCCTRPSVTQLVIHKSANRFLFKNVNPSLNAIAFPRQHAAHLRKKNVEISQ